MEQVRVCIGGGERRAGRQKDFNSTKFPDTLRERQKASAKIKLKNKKLSLHQEDNSGRKRLGIGC